METVHLVCGQAHRQLFGAETTGILHLFTWSFQVRNNFLVKNFLFKPLHFEKMPRCCFSKALIYFLSTFIRITAAEVARVENFFFQRSVWASLQLLIDPEMKLEQVWSFSSFYVGRCLPLKFFSQLPVASVKVLASHSLNFRYYLCEV